MEPVVSDIRRGIAWAILPVLAALAVRLCLEPAYLTAEYAALVLLVLVFGTSQLWLTRRTTPARIRAGLPVNLIAINVGYLAIGRALTSHAGWRADRLIFGFDQLLFDGDPQRFLAPLSVPWLSTVVMLGYLSFFALLLYLFLSEAFALGHATGRVQLGLMRLYGIGFATYVLLPAAGPAFHHPELLPPIQHSAFTAALQPWVLSNCSQVDVCPSLHAAVCAFTLTWLFRRRRALFWFLLPVAGALLLGTVYLQYHYFVDVPCGIALGVATAPSLSHEHRTPVLESVVAAR